MKAVIGSVDDLWQQMPCYQQAHGHVVTLTAGSNGVVSALLLHHAELVRFSPGSCTMCRAHLSCLRADALDELQYRLYSTLLMRPRDLECLGGWKQLSSVLCPAAAGTPAAGTGVGWLHREPKTHARLVA